MNLTQYPKIESINKCEDEPIAFYPQVQGHGCLLVERDIVSYLLNEQKVDPDTSCGNATALILAAKSGQTEIVKLLVKAGADISASYEGQTAADVALKNGHQEVLPLLK
ncbi:ankyrin repeat domain-containing protein [Nonlabens xiamenensis]|uniref:ankyrin repeat domain-containing protein n=1 Tax=Nonlabens xiamenensis TaxID=2341043 RepID=UPI000F606B00|nr:ankyrin repeat domain-containing protein [Nonlabens xiamenensis]